MANRVCAYILFIVLVMGCNDILNTPDPSAVGPDIWNSEETATLYINKRYEESLMGPGQQRWGGNASRSDEVPGGNDYIYGRLTSSSVGHYSVPYYERIRNLNIAIEEIEKGTLPEDVKARIKGQALFLRAYEYWGLVNHYGGVPLTLGSVNPYEDDIDLPRSRTSECIEQIIADLDEAIAGLPATWPNTERGRVTRGAAAALKGRVLLFWASPQFNPNNNADRWERAYIANKEAKDLLEQDGYGLYPDFERIFLEEGNQEFIFGELYSFSAGKTHAWDAFVRPRELGLHGGTTNNPTLNLVEAFPMANGRSIDDPNSGYDEIHYWKDRDPRFYATIAYNGGTYAVEGTDSDRKQWHYYVNGTSIEPEAPTTTGFYCRKAVNPEVPLSESDRVDTDWIEIRFAEVLVNLAECAVETGRMDEAYAELAAIRERAGIEPGAGELYGLDAGMNREQMIETIMQERQIEFAFENKRFWDLRRRNWFEKKLNGMRRYGIRTMLRPEIDPDEFEEIRDEIDLDTEFENYFTVEFWLKDEESEINFPQPLYNFFAIPPNQLDRSSAVEQTIGWGGGTFDPME